MDWISTIVNGLLLGSLYGLFGLGLAFAFGIMRIVNVAHGEFIVLAAFLGMGLFQAFGLNPVLLTLVVALVGFVVGYCLQFGVLNRVLDKDPMAPLLITFGLSIMLRNLMVEVFGANSQTIDIGAIRMAGFEVAGLNIGVLPLVIASVSVSLFVALQLMLSRTAFGRQLQATSDDPEIAQVFGIDYRRMYGIAMGIAVAMAAIAGVLLAMRSAFTPFSGADRLLIAFEVVIIGGLGSIWGALLGGLLLGVAHLVGLKIASGSGLLFAHLTFFLILIFLPGGLAKWRR